jgi:soluble lytic murein transglycosylase-like protein
MSSGGSSRRAGSAILVGVFLLVAPASAGTPRPQTVGCLDRAAVWAGVHPILLRAIAWVESRGNPSAVNRNRNGSTDVGLMQINSWWSTRGLEPWWRHLGSPCVNAAAGAWVLKQCVAISGYTWEAVGCYHAGADWPSSPARRAAGRAYIARVQRAISGATAPPK